MRCLGRLAVGGNNTPTMDDKTDLPATKGGKDNTDVKKVCVICSLDQSMARNLPSCFGHQLIANKANPDKERHRYWLDLAGKEQLLHLERFSIHDASTSQQYVSLESVQQFGGKSSPVASGTVWPARKVSQPEPAAGDCEAGTAVTGPIIDWCIEYGDKPAIWIITRDAWYRLGKPHASYSAVFETLQLRLELAVRCAAALAADPTAAAGIVRHRVLTGSVVGSNGVPIQAEQLSEAAEFLAGQMATLHQAGGLLRQPIPGATASDVIPFVAWLKQEGAAVAAGAPVVKRQRVGEAGQAVVTATAGGLPQQQPLVAVTPQPAAGPQTARMPSVAAAAAGTKPKIKAGPAGSGLKYKIKLKGQILPQMQPPPQDMGSQIQGHPPGYHEGHRQPAGQRAKLKFATHKADGDHEGSYHKQQQLQHQESWQFSDAQGGWGPPPSYPTSAPHGSMQHQRSYDYAAYDYYDDQGYGSQHPQPLTARQQQRAAAAAAKQAAIEAKAAAAAARAEEHARRQQQRLMEIEMRRQAEIAADIARGAPPTPTRKFRLPADLVGELLVIWELCQAFGGVLSIPPFSLEQLEAALLPGPLTEQQKQQSAEVTGAAADAEAVKKAQQAAAELATQLAEAAAAAERGAGGGETTAAAGKQRPPGKQTSAAAIEAAPTAAAQTTTAADGGSTHKQQTEDGTHGAKAVAAAVVDQQDADRSKASSPNSREQDATAVGNGPTSAERGAAAAAEDAAVDVAGVKQQDNQVTAEGVALRGSAAAVETAAAPVRSVSEQSAVPQQMIASSAVPAAAAASQDKEAATVPQQQSMAADQAAEAPQQQDIKAQQQPESEALQQGTEAPQQQDMLAQQQQQTGAPEQQDMLPQQQQGTEAPQQQDMLAQQQQGTEAPQQQDMLAQQQQDMLAQQQQGTGAPEQQDMLPQQQQGTGAPQQQDMLPQQQQGTGALQQQDTIESQHQGTEAPQQQGTAGHGAGSAVHQVQQTAAQQDSTMQDASKPAAATQQQDVEQQNPAAAQQDVQQQQESPVPEQVDVDLPQQDVDMQTAASPPLSSGQQGQEGQPQPHSLPVQQDTEQQIPPTNCAGSAGAALAEAPSSGGQQENVPSGSGDLGKHQLKQESVQLSEATSMEEHKESVVTDVTTNEGLTPQQPDAKQQQLDTELQADSAVQQKNVAQCKPDPLRADQHEEAQLQQQPDQPVELHTEHQSGAVKQQQEPLQHQLPKVQTPFAGHMPAPSTTSVGTGQAAASNSVGVAPSPSRQKLKLKVKLGGQLKQSSSQLQPVARGTTTPAAGGAAVTAATGMDPAAAAASWLQPAASTFNAQPEPEDDIEVQQLPDVGITDQLSLASSLVLRDVHSALLRLVDGTAPKPGKKAPKQPLVGKLCPGDTNQRLMAALMTQPHWSHRMAYAVSAAAGALLAAPEFKAQDVSSHLLNNDYTLLGLDVRMTALRCLLELALASETLRAHIDVRIEAYSAPKALRADAFRAFSGILGGSGSGQRGRPKGSGYYGAHDDLSAGPTEEERRAAAAAAERSVGGRMVEEWMEWLCQQEQQSVGLRRPLGVDFRGRQYWVLGGAAGAWRVFVEEQEGALWGYYEGVQMLQLIQWLACAAIEAEVPLLHTLCTMPWPYRPGLVLTAVSSAATAAASAAGADPPETPGSIAYWANVAAGGSSGYGANGYGFSYCFTPLEAGVEPLGPLVMAVGVRLPDAAQLMSARQMRRIRPDGYSKLSAPLMFGEAGVPGGSVLLSCEERCRAAIASLVAVLPFWLKQQQRILQPLGSAMDDLLAADSPAAYCEVVLCLESLLSDPEVQPAPLRSDWADWQQDWRNSLTKTGTAGWEALMLHVAMLGRFAVMDEFSLGRNTFTRIVNNSKCPLIFPAVGESYMFMRTGCLKHLNKYSQLPPSATAPLSPAADELQAAAVTIKQLPPVSCYKVIALAYCSYPMPEALKQQQQQQVAAAAAAEAAAAIDVDGVDAVRGNDAAGGGASLAADTSAGGTAAAAAAAIAEPGMSDDWPGLATLAGDGDEEIDSLLNVDIDELDIESLPGQIHQQQHQQQQPPALQAPEQQQQPQQADGAVAGSAAPVADAALQEPKAKTPPLHTDTPGAVEYRPPCMWALMSPVEMPHGTHDAGRLSGSVHHMSGSRAEQRPYIAVPFHVDAHLPDYLVSVPVYMASKERSWLPGDKFSMYIGGRQGQKVGGHYYKGSVLSVDEPLDGDEADPWCSITVLWDNEEDDSSQHTAKHKVSPWDIETDRDEVRKAEEAARKQQQAAAAAEELRRQEEAAAEARARRRASRTIADYSDLIGAVDDDDEYNPLAEGYSSDSDDGRGRRRGRKGKRGRGSDDEDFSRDAAAAGGKKSKGGSMSRLLGAAGGSSGAQWSLDQIKQQQSSHLPPKQQQMLGALATGNTLLLTRLTSAPSNAPIHEQPFPVPLKPDLLASFPNLEDFVDIVGEYNVSLKGKFEPPMWGQRALDLYTLFMVVSVRGGYEAVCRTNRWGDVCRSMGVTVDNNSGSNMRTVYEKCLVEFEQYLRSGRWQEDQAAGKPPTGTKADTDAAFEQVMRAGAAAAAAAPPPVPPARSAAAPVASAPGLAVGGVGVRPQLLPGASGGLVQMPGVAGLQPGTTAILARNAAGQPVVIQATPQQLLAIQLAQQQQQQLLLAKQQQQQGKLGPAAPVVLPGAIPAASAAAAAASKAAASGAPATAAVNVAATAAAQQQLLLRQQLLQQAQLQSAAAAAAGGKVMPAGAAATNPQLKLLLQQQAAAAVRPAGTAQLQLAGGLTLQQLQALQAQQVKAAAIPASGQASTVAAPGVTPVTLTPAASLALPPRPPAAQTAAAAAPPTSTASARQALAGTGSANFSSLLDDLME